MYLSDRVGLQMQQTSNDTHLRVLHIGPSPHSDRGEGSTTPGLFEILESSLVKVAYCEDVYRALARLCRASGNRPDLVIVRIDDVLPDEFEFFEILARTQRELPVFVYATGRSLGKVVGAIQQGARGAVTAGLLEQFLPQQADKQVGAPHDSNVRITEPDPTVGSGIERPLPDQRPVQGPPVDTNDAIVDPVGDVEIDAESESTPARVPWLRYSDRPVRQGPARPRASDSASNDSSAPTSQNAPLLTEEELRALMGDDPVGAPPLDEAIGGADDQARDGGMG